LISVNDRADEIRFPARYAHMDHPKPLAEMSDLELLIEWEYIEECDLGAARADALVVEMQKRQIDI